MTDRATKNIETQVIHGGQFPDPSTGAVMPPVYLTSTYIQKGPGEHLGFEYSRSQNPTRFALERCIAELEGGKRGFAFASGMAAISTIIEMTDPGEHVIVSDDVYGGTYRLFENIRKKMGVEFSFVDMTNPDNILEHIKDNTAMIWVETPTNPMLKLIDLQQVADMGKQHKLITVCDNTFATPALQKPLDYGFEMVVHSATKYINGHSDVVAGLVVVNHNEQLVDRIAYLQNAIGAIAGPFDSYMVLRGIKTLSLRMDRHCANAIAIAKFLEEHAMIDKVIYPGLASHPQHDLAKKQMSHFGGMISFEVKGDLARTVEVLKRFKIFALAESLGGVESLIEHPAIMTHASVPQEKREHLGIKDNFVRLSVGIEHVEDLKKDLDQALI